MGLSCLLENHSFMCRRCCSVRVYLIQCFLCASDSFSRFRSADESLGAGKTFFFMVQKQSNRRERDLPGRSVERERERKERRKRIEWGGVCAFCVQGAITDKHHFPPPPVQSNPRREKTRFSPLPRKRQRRDCLLLFSFMHCVHNRWRYVFYSFRLTRNKPTSRF